MSLTRTVPEAVPSLSHSCVPEKKNSVPLTFVRYLGLASEAICTVPAVVPSLFHRPPPLKNSVPLTLVNQLGVFPLRRTLSSTGTVPAAVPSLFHTRQASAPPPSCG